MKTKFKNLQGKIKLFWKNALTLHSSKKFDFIRFIQLINIAKENFKQSNSTLWAATLSFYSILSIVPVIAIIFSVAKNFGFEEVLKNELIKNLPIYKDVLNYTFSFATQLINSTKSSVIAGTGIVTLLWTVIRIFSLIETSFNEIWKITHSRNIFRKFTDYITLILLFPIMILLSNGVAAFFKTNLPEILYNVNIFNTLLILTLKFLPYFITSLTLSILYLVIPNTNVKIRSAIIAGVITGTLFQILQNLYLSFQIGIMSYNTIYGSFSIIPIFLIWQRILWILVLLGAHFSFILQNSYKYDYTIEKLNISFSERKKLSLLILYIYIKNFESKGKPISTHEIAEKIELSINIVQNLINELVILNFLIEVKVDEFKEVKYQIAYDINQITLDSLISKLETHGLNNILKLREDNVLYSIFQNLNNNSNRTEDLTYLLKDL